MRRLVALALLLYPAVAWAGADFASLEKTFKMELGSKKYEQRLRSFELWKTSADPRAGDLLIWATTTIVTEQETQRKAEEDTEAALEKKLNQIEAANKAMSAAAAPSTAQLDLYNKRMGKLESERDAFYAKQREYAVTRAQLVALMDASTTTLGAVGTNLEPGLLPALLDKVEATWGGAKSTPADRLRLVDVLTRIARPPAGERLDKFADSATEDARVRAAALSARVTRDDAGSFDDVLAALAGDAPWEVKAEAIDGLRRLHRRAGIEPLIEFLGVPDIGRLQTDATRALRSLTGQVHGPYKDPWKSWWDGAQATFQMPEKPSDGAGGPPLGGVTFEGITTFSDKILFVLDVSGSMKEPKDPSGMKPEPTKIQLMRKELNATIDMLDEKKKFNLVFFGHAVVRYKTGMVVADKVARDQAKRFVAELEPSGGTNIHDALETGFRLAGTAADGKTYASLIDTIFFLTDGTPTAGKTQEPKEILAAVREWNHSAHIVIHCIGIGDCDADFLKSLADQNGGQFVRR